MSLRLGIIGTGTIAHKMARTVPLVPAVTLAAVASRSQSTASAFAPAGNESGKQTPPGRKYGCAEAAFAPKRNGEKNPGGSGGNEPR